MRSTRCGAFGRGWGLVGLSLLLSCRSEPTPTTKAEGAAPADAVAPADGATPAETTPAETTPAETTPAETTPADASTGGAASAETTGPDEPGACTDPCAPRRLHAGRYPAELVVDDAHVYWQEGKALRRMPRDGGSAEVMVENVERGSVLLDDDALFVCRRLEDRSIDALRVPKDGTKPRILARALEDCHTALLGAHLYFPTRDDEGRWISRVPRAGGSPERVIASDGDFDQLVADETHLYLRRSYPVEIARVDPKIPTLEPVVTKREEIRRLGLTDGHVIWLELSKLMAVPKTGPTKDQGRVLSNFQDALAIVGDGSTVYWTSVAKERWCRMDLETNAMACHAFPEGGGDIAVHGSRVWWTVFDEKGEIYTLETCGCGADVLTPRRPLDDIEGPDEEDELRDAYADDGKIFVQVRDLSSDEEDAVTLLSHEHEGRIPPDDPKLPPRFRAGDEYRMANRSGVFDATLVGFETTYGGEGVYLMLILDAPKSKDAGGIVAKASGPPLAPIREAPSDAALAEAFVPAMRKAVRSAGFRQRVESEHITVVEAKLPPPHEVVITLAISKDEDAFDAGFLSAMMLGDTKGSITGAVLPPDDRLESFTIDYLIDIGKDGIDEVGFTSAYYEGSYELLLQWKGSIPTYVTLSGDGS